MKTLIAPHPALTISQAARLAGIGVETVRFYERQGLLREPDRTGSGYRQYNEGDVRRLAFIRRAKALGFSLREIKDLIALTEGRHASAGEVKALAEDKVDHLQEQIRDLQKIQKALRALVDECSGVGPASCCPILNAMTLESIGETPAQPAKKRRASHQSSTLNDQLS
jgi:MerR family copper efflux transcriptional regulator